MKKVIYRLGLLALIQTLVISAIFICSKAECVEIIETQKLPYIIPQSDLSKLYSYKQDIRKDSKNIVEIDYEDAQLLLSVAREEGGPTLDGQLWSMRTILNRVYSDEFPDNVYDVISESGQFEVFWTGKYINADVNANSHIALAMIEGGWDETNGTMWWEADTNSATSWHKQNLEYVKEVEGNIYYKEKEE